MEVYMILLSLTTVTMVSGRSASFSSLDRRLLKELLHLYENEVTGQEYGTNAEKRVSVLTFGLKLQKATAQLPACDDLGQFYQTLSVCGLARASNAGAGCTCSDVYAHLNCITDYVNQKRPLYQECTRSDFKQIIERTLAATPCLKHVDLCSEYLVKLTIRNENCNTTNSIVNTYIQTADTIIDTLLQDAVHPKVRFFCREDYERIYYRTYLTHDKYVRVKDQLWDKLREAQYGSYLWGSDVYRDVTDVMKAVRLMIGIHTSRRRQMLVFAQRGSNSDIFPVRDNAIDRCFDMRSLQDKSVKCFQDVLDMHYQSTAVCKPARSFLYCLGSAIEKASNEPACEVDVLDNHQKTIQLINFLYRKFPQNEADISQLSLYDAEKCATNPDCC